MRRCAPYILVALIAGCGSNEPTDDVDNEQTTCTGAKCDTPDDDPDYSVAEICVERQGELLRSNREIFQEDFIRWSCADVRGVNTNNEDSRGQEYCEYWAGLRTPPEAEGGDYGEPVTLGRPLPAQGNETTEMPVTELSLDLTEEQIFYLEDHIDEVMGSCYFSTWFEDVDAPYPACNGEGECGQTRDGIDLSAEYFQMKVFFNSGEAANVLIDDCVSAVLSGEYDQGEPDSEENDLQSDYIRGCHLADTAFGFSWRKSDTSICSASMRLAECGCVSDATAAADTLVPLDGVLRGFPLGGWAGAADLPAGCDYVDTGDESRTLVACDLTGGDVLQAQSDLKGYCREKYGDNVVVYVPLAPLDGLTCEPPAEGAYADTCSDTPWVITN